MRALAHSRASLNRSISRSTSAAGTVTCGARGGSQRSTYAGPITMPGEAEMPSRISDTRVLLLVEFVLDQFDQLAQSSFRIITGGANDNITAALGGQHHHTHDALAVDFELLFPNEDFRLK